MDTTQENNFERTGPRRVKLPQRTDAYRSRGTKIMGLADKLRGPLLESLADYRNKDGLPFPPSRVHAIALNMAQYIVKRVEGEA
ncbi:MAG: hypothetical protein JO089_03295 [Alphaproteobacteria bacterium]|nr:hypothetical protein [Alphaproteobacteria bacterium]